MKMGSFILFPHAINAISLISGLIGLKEVHRN
jgi:hypothetical protein